MQKHPIAQSVYVYLCMCRHKLKDKTKNKDAVDFHTKCSKKSKMQNMKRGKQNRLVLLREYHFSISAYNQRVCWILLLFAFLFICLFRQLTLFTIG